MLIGRPLCWVAEAQSGGWGSSQLQSEGPWKRNSRKGERNVSCGLSFLSSLPSLSQLLILRLQVERVGQEGIPNESFHSHRPPDWGSCLIIIGRLRTTYILTLGYSFSPSNILLKLSRLIQQYTYFNFCY